MPAPLAAGTLLVASPDLSEDPNFKRSVVFLIHYRAEEGAMGIVINRPLGKEVHLYSAEELQRLTGADPEDENIGAQVGQMFFQGGPVQQSWLFFLHRLNGVIEGGVEILDGLYLGGDLDAVRAEAEMRNADEPLLRFFLGYAGWEAGQLEAEINHGAWILAPGDPDLVFPTQANTLWHDVLYSLGGKYRPLSVLPEDPAVN